MSILAGNKCSIKQQGAVPNTHVSLKIVDDKKFSSSEIKAFQKLFSFYDSDSSGSINLYELKQLVQHLGMVIDDTGFEETILRQIKFQKESLLHRKSTKIINTKNRTEDKNTEITDHNQDLTEITFDNFMHWLSTKSESGDPCSILKSKIRAHGTQPLTTEQIQNLKNVFNHFDADGSGSIDITELEDVFKAMGQQMSNDQLEEFMKEADDDNNGTMEFEEFLLLMCSHFGINSNFDQVLLAKFHEYDDNKSGLISIIDLEELMINMCGSYLSNDDLKEVLDIAHVRGDGYVEYNKWDSLWDAARYSSA